MKVFCEGCSRRSSGKDVAEGLDEGLRRRSWMNDFDEGEVSEGSKSVDFIINSDLHCNLHIFTFWTKTIQREIYRDYFLIS